MLYFSRSSSGQQIMLMNGVNYTVGSKSDDLPLLQDGKVDKSISRSHAALSVQFDKKNSKLSLQESRFDVIEPVVICKDSSSYGTYVNKGIETKTRIEKGVLVTLKPNDKIRFGLQWNTYVCCFKKTITLIPNEVELNSIADVIWTLCSYTLDTWNYEIIPTHLTTNVIEVTPEFLCSLCHNIPVVTTEYWKQYLQSLKKKSDPPKVEDYFPPIQDPEITKDQILLPGNAKRNRLFLKKMFIFTNLEEYATYKDVVECAGGVASKWKCYTKTVEEASNSDDYIVIGGPENYLDDTESSGGKAKSLEKLKALKTKYDYFKRFIPLEEISQAILHGSTDVYCNIRCKPDKFLRPRRETESLTRKAEPGILARDTQDLTPPAHNRPKQPQVVLASYEEEPTLDDDFESIVTFRDQMIVPPSKSQQNTKRQGGRKEGSPVAKVARMDNSLPCSSQQQDTLFSGNTIHSQGLQDRDEDVFEFDMTRALGKNPVEPLTRTSTVEATSSRSRTPERTASKRARNESSSDEEDASGEKINKTKEEDNDTDIFGFEEISTKSTAKKLRTASNNHLNFGTAGPSRQASQRPIEHEDTCVDKYELDGKWLHYHMKRELVDDSQISTRISRINMGTDTNTNNSVSIITPPHPGCQKVFRKTGHRCMSSIPSIISYLDMKKINCVTGKPVS